MARADVTKFFMSWKRIIEALPLLQLKKKDQINLESKLKVCEHILTTHSPYIHHTFTLHSPHIRSKFTTHSPCVQHTFAKHSLHALIAHVEVLCYHHICFQTLLVSIINPSNTSLYSTPTLIQAPYNLNETSHKHPTTTAQPLQIVRFIGELVKFKMFSKNDALYCLKVPPIVAAFPPTRHSTFTHNNSSLKLNQTF